MLSNLENLSDLIKGSTIRLAVTGLSRAGKTVFITSLVHNLLSIAGRPTHRMELLRSAGRIAAVSLPGAGARAVLPFPYKANVARMGSTAPDWPRPTDDISEIEVDIKFRPRGLWQIPSVGNIAGRLATLRVKITDYPGEWLLDLPLLQQDFISWSRATVDRCRRGLRGQLAKEWLDFIAWHGHDEAADGDVAKRAHDLYRTFLGKARACPE